MPLGRYFGLYVAILCLSALITAERLENVDSQLSRRETENELVATASLLSSKLQAELNTTLYLVAGLGSYISINNGIDAETFELVSKSLFESKAGLVNIAIAPDLVVRHVYPLKGNEAAIGLNYREEPKQREAVMQVIETGLPVVAGPVNLVQGGVAVIARIPVFTRDPNTGVRHTWGIIAVPYDLAFLYEVVGIYDMLETHDIAIRGTDGKGAKGEVFFGDPDLFDKSPILAKVALLSGSWQVAILPKGGWPLRSPGAYWIRGVVVFILILLISIGYLMVKYLRRTEEARVRQVEANQSKTRFYANMSHEIRTPLNAICGMAELIETTSSDTDSRQSASMIRKSGESLNRLLEDVMSLGVLETSENQSLETVEVNVNNLVEDLLPALSIEAQRKGLEIDVSFLRSGEQTFRTEPSMLRQILWNLISNAIKFTSEGRVTLEIGRLASGPLVLTVTDTGIGISPDRHKSIFQPYTQVDDSLSREYGGIGVGLSIVDRMLKRLGGDIRVESKQGRGARFIVVLPPYDPERINIDSKS